MKALVRLLSVSVVIIYLFHFFFLWVYTNIDGYFYWALGQYFKTGSYPFISPFIYARPTTISPPLYGMLLVGLQTLPRADIGLHLLQLAMLVTTAFFLYNLLTSLTPPLIARAVSLLFLLHPSNLIYASYLMTEISAQFCFTLYLYLLFVFYKTKHSLPLALGVALSGLMTLLKYQFALIFGLTFILFVYHWFRSDRKNILPWLFPILGMGIITVWVITNHAITGVWGLSDTKKLQFYTSFVWDGKHFPREDNPAVASLRKYVPSTVDRYAMFWDLQDYILPHVNREWRAIDELLGNVGMAAVREQPLAYLANAGRVFVQTHLDNAPWWQNLTTFGFRDPVQPLYCEALGTIQMCQPIIMTPYSYRLWNAFARSATIVYDLTAPLFGWLFLASLMIVLLWGGRARLFAVIYLVALLPSAFFSVVESRYLIPFYPLMILVMVGAVQTARQLFWRRPTYVGSIKS